MPFISVCPVSRSSPQVNVGSSFLRMFSVSASFCLSADDSGSIDRLTTACAKLMRSSRIGCSVSHSVSPVIDSFRPNRATMSPATASASSTRSLGSALVW